MSHIFPLQQPDDITALAEKIGQSKYVFLGESSHGTSEFYTWRAHISKKLITDYGFDYIAVEGDWPDCYQICKYIQNTHDTKTEAFSVLHDFSRWPTWMWANWEIVHFVEWMKNHNTSEKKKKEIGFYGLDVYSLWESIEAIKLYLQKNYPEHTQLIYNVYRCFFPYRENFQQYGMDNFYFPDGCADEITDMLKQLRYRKMNMQMKDTEGYFNATQNAMIIQNAEQYYRQMIRGGPQSWNMRDTHMWETLQRLTKKYGEESKGIIWAHNTHIGDARATDMEASGMLNIGQLARENMKKSDVALVGFSTYQGSVIAGNSWDAPMEIMTVPSAKTESIDEILHNYGGGDDFFCETQSLPSTLNEKRGQRAIGVVYDPSQEQHGNYVPTYIKKRYDYLLFCDSTRPLHPLHISPEEHTVPDLYPWGL